MHEVPGTVTGMLSGLTSCPYLQRRTYAPRPESVGAARHDLAAALDRWGCPQMADLAQLLASELVTNAVRHTRAAHHVSVAAELIGEEHQRLRVRVYDEDGASIERVRAHDADPDDTGGRGLSMVDIMADRWGVDPTVNGKVVWFEVEPKDD